MDISNTINDFYNTLQDFNNNLVKISPDTIIGKNKKYVDDIIAKDKDVTASIIGKNKIIDTFVLKVLKYKKDIENRNESFFVKTNYNEDLNNNQNHIDRIFEFKSIWHTLNPTNKEFIFQYMFLLCILAENYFLLKYPTTTAT